MIGHSTTRALTVTTANGTPLAVEITDGQGPPLLWLCGYASALNGGKATWLKQQCETWGYQLIRFNYRCMNGAPAEEDFTNPWYHNAPFSTQTISQHVEDAMAVVNQLVPQQAIVIGSSMGGWVSMRLMQHMPNKIAGFVGIAAAPDFAAKYNGMVPVNQNPSHPPVHLPIIADSINNMVLHNPLPFNKPVALVQGMNDSAVPWETVHKIASTISSEDITIHLVKDAAHSLSRPHDLALLWQAMTTVREKVLATAG